MRCVAVDGVSTLIMTRICQLCPQLGIQSMSINCNSSNVATNQLCLVVMLHIVIVNIHIDIIFC